MAEILGKPLPPLAGEGRGAEDSVSRLAMLRGEPCPPRAPIFPNDHKEAPKRKGEKDSPAWVAVRSNAAPIPGQWKLFLDHRFATAGEIRPQELYNLADDPMEKQNRLADPAAKPALDFLIAEARRAAGDGGASR